MMYLIIYWLYLASGAVLIAYSFLKKPIVGLWAALGFALFLNHALPWHLVPLDFAAAGFRIGILVLVALWLVCARQGLRVSSLIALSAISVVIAFVSAHSLLFSFLSSPDPGKLFGLFYRVVFPSLILALLFKGDIREIKGLGVGVVGGGFLLVLLMLAFGGQTHHSRLDMEFGTLGTITAGRMAGFAIVALVWFWISREVKIGNNWTSNVIVLAFVGVLFWGLIYAGTRGPAVGVVAALAVYAVWNLFSRSLAKMGLAAVTLSLMGGVPVLISMMGGDAIGLSGGVFRGLDGESLDRNAHARLMMWANSFDIIRNNPLGLGIGGYFNETGVGYPHNFLLEVGVELGLVPAFLLAFGLLFCMLLLFLRMVKGDGVSAFLLASLVYWAVAASFSYSLEYNEGLFFLLVLSVLWLLGGVRVGSLNRAPHCQDPTDRMPAS